MKRWLDYIFPPRCLFCQGPSGRSDQLCFDCEQDLPLITHACYQCGIPLSSTGFCGKCLQTNPAYDYTIALYHYSSPIDFAITALKFGGKLSYAEVLGKLLVSHLQKYYANRQLPEIIIPVPLHRLRLRERGFNQALEIARIPAAKLQIPVDKYSWQRIKNTVWQSSLSAAERQKNIKNVFLLRKKTNFTYQHVAVIDDVITTGATINEFCKTLRKAGVKQIDVWCCARVTTGRHNNLS